MGARLYLRCSDLLEATAIILPCAGRRWDLPAPRHNPHTLPDIQQAPRASEVHHNYSFYGFVVAHSVGLIALISV